LQRVIDKEIKRPLAKMMLFGELRNGGGLLINVVDDKLVLIPTPRESKMPLLTVDSEKTLVNEDVA